MNIVEQIWMEPDQEIRSYLWSHYLQEISDNIKNLELSPTYKFVNKTSAEFQQLLNDYEQFKDFGNQLTGVNLRDLRLDYTKNDHSLDIHRRIEEVQLNYMPSLIIKQKECNLLKTFAYENTSISSIGIERLYTKEGMLFVKNSTSPTIYSYKYSTSPIVNERKRSILHLSYLATFKESLTSTCSQLKRKLNKQLNLTLNGYLVEYDLDLPFAETALPVAKGKLSRYLNL